MDIDELKKRLQHLEEVKKRLQHLEDQWTLTRAELRTVRDWQVEAHLHFQLIDIRHAHNRLLSLLPALTAE